MKKRKTMIIGKRTGRKRGWFTAWRKQNKAGWLLISIVLIIAGTVLSFGVEFPKNRPETERSNFVIYIAAERYLADIEVSCIVEKEGDIVLQVGAGSELEESVRVWIFAIGILNPFEWEIVQGIDNVVIESVFSDGEQINEEDTLMLYAHGVRLFESQKSGKRKGVSREDLSPVYNEFFTTVIEPREINYYMTFRVESEYMEKRQYGKTEIKIPWITSLRDSPIYRTGAGEINTMLQTEGVDAFKYLYSNCTIDGNEVMEPKLHVFAMYLGDYCKRFDYVIDEIVPDPEQVYPCIIWEEETQLVPKVVFQDLNYDGCGFLQNWIGGILIAVGSGLAVVPISEWLDRLKNAKEIVLSLPWDH